MILSIYCSLFLFILIYKIKNNRTAITKIKCFNIAHGCGMIDKVLYTNALEAFYKSYTKGYKNIEVDLRVVNGSHIIGAHDMERFKNLTNYSYNEKVDYNYIITKKILNKYTIIYDYMLYNLLIEFKDVHIFTDKITNYSILKKYTKLLNRIYVEVFNYNQFIQSSKLGFENIMLNIRSKESLLGLINNKNCTIKSITINPYIFYTYKEELRILFKRNISIFAYLINNLTDMKLSFCKFVNGFYID